MATIRPQQLAPINYGDSNQLLRAAQQMILQGAGGLTDAFTGYRNAVVDRNTANVVNTLTGATDLQDLARRQQTAQSLLQAAGGDINNEAVQRTQLTMPDTLITRQRGQNALTEFSQQQHDQPLLNQAMSLYAAGDSDGANRLLNQVQGDATKAVTFGANRSDEAYNRQLQQKQLGIQQAGLALRQQAARERAAAVASGNKQMQNLLKTITGINATAQQDETEAAVEARNKQEQAIEKSNPLNNPKGDVAGTVRQITNDNRSWLTAPLPNAWRSDRGGKLQELMTQLDPEGTLTPSQQVNLLQGMNQAFDGVGLTGNPDKAALDWGKNAIDQLQKAQQAQLKNTQARISNKRATQLARQQVLLSAMGGNGSLNPLALQLLNFDDEE